MVCIIYREVITSLSKSQFRAKNVLVLSVWTAEAGATCAQASDRNN